MSSYLVTYRSSPIRGRCTMQVTSDLLPAAVVAKRFAAEHGVAVLRCQLLGKEAHLHPTDWCLYDSKDHRRQPMTQAPVHEPEDDTPEEEEDGEDEK